MLEEWNRVTLDQTMNCGDSRILLTSTCDFLGIAGGSGCNGSECFSRGATHAGGVGPTEISAGNPGDSGWVSSDYT